MSSLESVMNLIVKMTPNSVIFVSYIKSEESNGLWVGWGNYLWRWFNGRLWRLGTISTERAKLIIRGARLPLCNFFVFWPFVSQTSKGCKSTSFRGIDIIFEILGGVNTISWQIKRVIVKLRVIMNHWKYFIVWDIWALFGQIYRVKCNTIGISWVMFGDGEIDISEEDLGKSNDIWANKREKSWKELGLEKFAK